MEDVDLFEVNEAFASMMVYCVEKLSLPMDRLNVNGGAMCVNGHSRGSVDLDHHGSLSFQCPWTPSWLHGCTTNRYRVI